METYQKNAELEDLVHKINEHIETIKKIDDTEAEKKNIQSKLDEHKNTIKSDIDQRKSLLEQLKTYIKKQIKVLLRVSNSGLNMNLMKVLRK